MLILRYGYELEDGTVKQVSCCLKKCSQYSVGRSNNNKLRIKNDKSISRQHVLVKWTIMRADRQSYGLLMWVN